MKGSHSAIDGVDMLAEEDLFNNAMGEGQWVAVLPLDQKANNLLSNVNYKLF